jgi:predicted DNA binding CopG/RHH family protein
LPEGLIRVITARNVNYSERRIFRRKQVDRMKRRLSPANSPLPKFGSDKEAPEHFESHSVAGVWDQLPTAKKAKLSAPPTKSIRDRRESAKAPISIRLVPEQIAAAQKIAAKKSVGYQTQLRMWIAEGIRREAKRI